MFEFAFVQALFELAYARPQFDPLFELPPNIHSSHTILPTIGEWVFEVLLSQKDPTLILHYFTFLNFLIQRSTAPFQGA